MTPHSPTHVTIGGLLMRTRAIDCYDWSRLLGSPAKHGQDQDLPDFDGVEPGPRSGGALLAALFVRIRGDYDHDNAKIPGGEDAWVANLYVLLAELREVTEVNELQSLTFTWPGGEETVDCRVEEGGVPEFANPWTVELALSVTVPSGALMLTVGS